VWVKRWLRASPAQTRYGLHHIICCHSAVCDWQGIDCAVAGYLHLIEGACVHSILGEWPLDVMIGWHGRKVTFGHGRKVTTVAEGIASTDQALASCYLQVMLPLCGSEARVGGTKLCGWHAFCLTCTSHPCTVWGHAASAGNAVDQMHLAQVQHTGISGT
jgi:hypothetical protein